MGYRVAEPFEFLVRLRERLVGAAPLGEIAGHLGIPDEAALRVPHRTDHAIGPEARAVLAHAPPFVFLPALARGEREQPRRLSLCHGLRRVEAGEMLPYDLLRPVPLDALRPGIPGGDATRAIQHEDRDVLDALDQPSEGLRGFAGGGNGGHYAFRQHDDKYARAYISCKTLATACPRRGAATLEASVEDESWSCANTCPSPRTPHSGSEGKPAISSSAAPRTRSARRWHTRPSAACPHTSWAAAATWSSSTQGSPDSSCASPSAGWSSVTGRAPRSAPAPESIGTGWCKPWWHAAGPESSACRGSPGRSAARRCRTWALTGKRSPRVWWA